MTDESEEEIGIDAAAEPALRLGDRAWRRHHRVPGAGRRRRRAAAAVSLRDGTRPPAKLRRGLGHRKGRLVPPLPAAELRPGRRAALDRPLQDLERPLQKKN